MKNITRILLTIVTVLLATSLFAEGQGQRYIVILKQRSGAAPDVAALGGTIESRQEDQLVVTIPAASLAALRSDHKVRYIERAGGDPSDADDALIGVPVDPSPGPASKLRLTPIALGSTTWSPRLHLQRDRGDEDGASYTFEYDAFDQPLSKKYNNDSGNQEYYLYTPVDERIGVQRGSWWTWSVRDESGKVLRQYRSSTTNTSAPSLWLEDLVRRDGLLLGSQRPP